LFWEPRLRRYATHGVILTFCLWVVVGLQWRTITTVTPQLAVSLLPTVASSLAAPVIDSPVGECDTRLVTAPNKLFIWPICGPISSFMGPGHPIGIDIDLYWAKTEEDKIVRAPASGVVTYTGGNPCCSLGNYLVIDHQNDFQTLYAHLGKILVVDGQEVKQGEVIAIAGRSGYSTGPHLHFEVHHNGVPVNPFDYLP